MQRPTECEVERRFQYLQELGKNGATSTNPPEDTVLVSKEGSVATVTINRSPSRNALNTFSWRSLAQRFQELGEDQKITAVVLQGAGRNFCAGADISEIHRFAEASKGDLSRTKEIASDYFSIARHTMMVMDNSPFVIIARMEGFALGIGSILALACDRRIADETVRTGVPAGKLGIMLDPREIWRMVTHVGMTNANKIIYSGEIFNPKESYQLGMVDTLVAADGIEHAIQKAAKQAAAQTRGAIMTAKSGFGLIAGTPGFGDDDISPERHYSWVNEEGVGRWEAFLGRNVKT